MLADVLEADGTPISFESDAKHAARTTAILDVLVPPQMGLSTHLIEQNASHRQSKTNVDLCVLWRDENGAYAT